MTLRDAMLHIIDHCEHERRNAARAITLIDKDFPTAVDFSKRIIARVVNGAYGDMPGETVEELRAMVTPAEKCDQTLRARVTANDINCAQLVADRKTGGNVSELIRRLIWYAYNHRNDLEI